MAIVVCFFYGGNESNVPIYTRSKLTIKTDIQLEIVKKEFKELLEGWTCDLPSIIVIIHHVNNNWDMYCTKNYFVVHLSDVNRIHSIFKIKSKTKTIVFEEN